MTEAVYKDDFTCSFENEIEFIKFLWEREEKGQWQRVKNKDIKFYGMVKGNTLTKIVTGKFRANGKSDILLDTMEHTAMVAEIDKIYYPIRSTAIKTVLERARISGNALKSVKKNVLADILNECMKVSQGKALVRYTDNKLSAMHSGDNSYKILTIPELFETVGDWLESNYPGYSFTSSYFEHAMVSATWKLPDREDLLKTYNDFLAGKGLEQSVMEMALMLTTSDVGISSAKLYPMLMSDSRILPIGNEIKLTHRHQASIEKFNENLEGIFGQFNLAIGQLKHLADIEIAYPLNCMGYVMKRIGIAKKPALEALEMFKQINGSEPCTAHDIYYAIGHVVFLQQCSGVRGWQLVQLEEKVARALKVHWSDYDIPGDFKW